MTMINNTYILLIFTLIIRGKSDGRDIKNHGESPDKCGDTSRRHHKIVCREPSGMNGENIVLYSTAEKKIFF